VIQNECRYFFKYCREIVSIRWVLRFGPRSSLRLVRVTDVACPPFDLYIPVVAVAADTFGSKVRDPKDVYVAAEALELGDEFATILFAASYSNHSMDARVSAVRAELIDSLDRENCLLSFIRAI